MKTSVLPRDRYDGVARELAVWWTLRREATKGEAVCRMFTEGLAELVASSISEEEDRNITSSKVVQ